MAKGLTRDQLAAFLPDHQAVKAFEDLFQQVLVIIPGEVADLEGIVASQKQDRLADTVRTAVQDIEAQQAKRPINLRALEVALEEIQTLLQQGRRVNLQPLTARVSDVEAQQGKRPANLKPLEDRVSVVESFLGLS